MEIEKCARPQGIQVIENLRRPKPVPVGPHPAPESRDGVVVETVLEKKLDKLVVAVTSLEEKMVQGVSPVYPELPVESLLDQKIQDGKRLRGNGDAGVHVQQFFGQGRAGAVASGHQETFRSVGRHVFYAISKA